MHKTANDNVLAVVHLPLLPLPVTDNATMPRPRRATLDRRSVRSHVAAQPAAHNGCRDPNARPTPFTPGPMTCICPHCNALRFPNESLNCCHNGKVDLPVLSPYPEELRILMQDNTSDALNFLNNIRQYNSPSYKLPSPTGHVLVIQIILIIFTIPSITSASLSNFIHLHMRYCTQ
jgi:hypothetical protein